MHPPDLTAQNLFQAVVGAAPPTLSLQWYWVHRISPIHSQITEACQGQPHFVSLQSNVREQLLPSTTVPLDERSSLVCVRWLHRHWTLIGQVQRNRIRLSFLARPGGQGPLQMSRVSVWQHSFLVQWLHTQGCRHLWLEDGVSVEGDWIPWTCPWQCLLSDRQSASSPEARRSSRRFHTHCPGWGWWYLYSVSLIPSLLGFHLMWELEKVAHELARIVGDTTGWVFAHDEHLMNVGFGLDE